MNVNLCDVPFTLEPASAYEEPSNTFNFCAVVSNTKSPTSLLDEGTPACTLYLSAKLFTPVIFVATVPIFVFAPATVFMFVIAPATAFMFV